MGDESADSYGEVRAELVAAEAAAAAAAAAVETPASRELCEQIARESDGVIFLGFSRGKDSLAAWLYLRRFFSRIIPFHCASVPHLRFVDESLAYYEEFFGTRILRYMDGACTGALGNLYWQPPGSEDEIDALELWEFDKHVILERLRYDLDLPDAWCAFGINMTDSIDRRIYVNKYQGHIDNNLSFYPTYDWPKKLIMEQLRQSGVKLPGDYRLASRSLAAVPTYRHALRMREVYPDDWARLLLMWPMLEAELARQEFRRERAQRAQSTETPCTSS